ncbi:MAG: efflux RND transporter periplasmic adaptor subunit [Candidatus Tritonobacter lacicola]|nr:efflux RND transporter periplasmic adaptor subunit [Candidatus Tritonobacter lacicola]
MQSKHRRIGLIWKIGIGLVCFLVILKFVYFRNNKSSLEVMRTVQVRRGDLTVEITATGEVKPQNRVEVKPPIDGRIDEVLVEEGDDVKQGQILAWMSSTERAALLDAARSQGQDVLDRWEKAYKPAPLIAPVDGMIIVRAVEPGQTVTPTDPVVVISDRLIVVALVDETDLSLISLGQEAEVRLDAYREQAVEATVDHISYESRLENNVNVYTVDILPGNVPPMFRSGMTATVTFTVFEHKGVLLVPSEAIGEWPLGVEKPRGTEFAVYRKTRTGKPVPVPVRIGKSDGRFTEILEGAKEGDELQVVRRKTASRGSNPFSPVSRRR